jgi:RNase P protein component
MFVRNHRLARTADITRVRKKGRRARNRYLGAQWRANGLLFSRFAIVVSTKVSKRAVVRNRVGLSDIVRGQDVIISLFPPATQATRAELQTAVDDLLQKSRLAPSKKKSQV